MNDEMKKRAKEKVLDQLMEAMDEKIVDGLRKPKVAKVDIELDDPALADDLKDKLMGDSDSDEDVLAPETDESEPSEDEKAQIAALYHKYCK